MAVELTLEWRDGEASHRNALYFNAHDAASLRRELGLPDSGTVSAASIGVPQGVAPTPRRVERSDFNERAGRWATVTPEPGRWYPARLLDGAEPEWPLCRAIEVTPDHLFIDTAHPLAAFEVEVTIADCPQLASVPGYAEAPAPDRLRAWLRNGPGVEAVRQDVCADYFSPEAMRRDDESDDARFYTVPRLVHHIDGYCRAALAELYAGRTWPGGRVLDIMSSWVTHLPEDFRPGELVCVGLNGEELNANPRATGTVCQDLNTNPELPFDSRVFDAALCSVSVEYLTRPDAVFAEVARVLTRGGAFVNGFSERWFPTKIIRIWAVLHPFERLRLVTELYRRCEAFGPVETFTRHGAPRPPDDEQASQMPEGDPVYAAWGCRI